MSNIIQMIGETQTAITEIAKTFIESPQLGFGEAEKTVLLNALKSGGITKFQHRLRSSMPSSLTSVQRSLCWEMIDMVSFWEDAHPGRWRYTKLEDQKRYLKWIREAILLLLCFIGNGEEYFNSFAPSL